MKILFSFLLLSAFAFNSSHKSVNAAFETTPVSSSGDAADDTALWFHPQNPRQSLIVATDKKAGLLLYSLQGNLVSSSPVGLINNIDAQEEFHYGNQSITLLVGSDRSKNAIALFSILDPAHPQITKLGSISLGYVPYGICATKNSMGSSIFITTKEGLIDHWSVHFVGTRMVSKHIGNWKISSKTEGCVADEKTGQLFVSEEAVGLWKFDLNNPQQPPLLVDSVGSHRLTADVEGVAIYRNPSGVSYLLVSSQGDNSFHAYDIETLAHKGSFTIDAGNDIDGVSDTDGIEILGADRIDLFPEGLFIAQDGENHDGKKTLNQNFKAVLWSDIRAALQL